MTRWLWLGVAALLGCGGPGGGAADGGDPICADAPLVTYENFGAGFLAANCQSCHGSMAQDRHQAPEAITFDTRDQVMALRRQILARAGLTSPTMPPGGGVKDDDRQRVEYWLRCGDP